MTFRDLCKNVAGGTGFFIGGTVGLVAGAISAGASAVGLTEEKDPGKAFEKALDACVYPCIELGEEIGEKYGPELVLGVGARVAARQINNAIEGNNSSFA